MHSGGTTKKSKYDQTSGCILNLNLNQLRYFNTVAKYKNITKAASELCVSPAAVTLQIKNFEEMTGVRLLIRSGNTMRLTDAGLKIQEKLETIFDQINMLEMFIMNIGEKKDGILKIGCSETANIYVVPFLIKAFKSAYPGIKLVVGRGNTTEMLESLLNHKNELVISRYDPDEKRVKMRYMGVKEIVLAAAKNSRLLSKDIISALELNGIPVILPTQGSATRQIVLSRLNDIGVSPNVVMESSSIPFIKDFTCSDEGVTFFCRNVIINELSDGLLKEVQLKDFSMNIEYGVSYLNRSNLSQAAQAFLKMIDSFIEQGKF
jgi:DNA-binding transcriptional LysR family regulator